MLSLKHDILSLWLLLPTNIGTAVTQNCKSKYLPKIKVSEGTTKLPLQNKVANKTENLNLA